MLFSLKTITSLWLGWAVFWSTLFLQTGEPVRLSLQNIPLQDEKLLVVNVLLEEVNDLYGAELQLRYDPTQLKVRDDNQRLEGVQITPGPLLAFDNRFVANNQVDTETGLIEFVFTLLNPAPPIDGQGVLATIIFEISGNGPFTIEVTNAQLVSSSLQPIPVITRNLHLNGQPLPATAPPETTPQPEKVTPFPQPGWSIILGSLAVTLGLILWLRLRQIEENTTTTEPVNRTMPGANHTSTNASTLLTHQGNQLRKQSNLQSAYNLFSRAIELDPANTQAWLGKGRVARLKTEKRICFQRVLALEPDNKSAQTELQQLESRSNNV